MKTKIVSISVIALLALASCGGKKNEKANNNDSTQTKSENTNQTTTNNENQPLVKNYDYFSKKLDGFSIGGVNTTKDLVNDDPSSKDIRRSWLTDPAAVGCDKIQINAFSLARTGNRKETENKSLDEYKTFQTKYLSSNVKASDFKEYKSDSLTFYYCTMKGCNASISGPKDYNQICFSHFTGDVGINGWVMVYDNKADMKKAEDIAIKCMDFLAKP